MDIRPAQAGDAEAAIDLVRRSITQLCREDHYGDPLTLEGWLANKSVKNMRAWIETPGSNVFIAERAGALAGVGGFTGAGDVILLYVEPALRFNGVSAGLLARIEERAREIGLPRLRLTSSLTARRFFLERGYVEEEDEGDIFASDETCELTKEL